MDDRLDEEYVDGTTVGTPEQDEYELDADIAAHNEGGEYDSPLTEKEVEELETSLLYADSREWP